MILSLLDEIIIYLIGETGALGAKYLGDHYTTEVEGGVGVREGGWWRRGGVGGVAPVVMTGRCEGGYCHEAA